MLILSRENTSLMFRNYSDFFEEVETDKGIASEQLKKEILKKKLLAKKDAEKYVHAYQLACLLHDVVSTFTW